MAIRIITFIGMACFCFLGQEIGQAGASSIRMTKEQQEAIKVSTCKELGEEKTKVPAKLHPVYDHIENVICKDPNSDYFDPENYLTNTLTADEYLEVRIFRVGKEQYCNYILGLSQLWRNDDPNETVYADKITTPEYLEFKQFCQDSTKTEADIIPLAQTLQKIYYHF